MATIPLGAGVGSSSSFGSKWPKIPRRLLTAAIFSGVIGSSGGWPSLGGVLPLLGLRPSLFPTGHPGL
eukprot:6335884-Pyramimonas_sp.AAC.1